MHRFALLGLMTCACVTPTDATQSATIHPATGSTPPTPRERTLQGLAPRPIEATPDSTPDAFSWWDRDRDGVLTADELTEIWIARLDRDDDGTITRSEWPG